MVCVILDVIKNITYKLCLLFMVVTEIEIIAVEGEMS